ncbi:MAG: PEGA domain-containing protein, partial [Bacteroidales bacterium]|nr:PEGA domain-containing protein [Bacteroidales bacterium]
MRIESDKTGDNVFVDGVRVGDTPCDVNIPFGMHKVKIVRNGKDKLIVVDSAFVERNINVENDDNNTIVKMPLGMDVTIRSMEKNKSVLIDNQEVGRR